MVSVTIVIGILIDSETVLDEKDPDLRHEKLMEMDLEYVGESGVRYFRLPHDQHEKEEEKGDLIVGFLLDTIEDKCKSIDFPESLEAFEIMKKWKVENSIDREVKIYAYRDHCNCCS